jgi:hypothetical protein
MLSSLFIAVHSPDTYQAGEEDKSESSLDIIDTTVKVAKEAQETLVLDSLELFPSQ